MNDNIDPVSEAGDVYELDELLGAYALDALDADERRRVEDYLHVNPRAAAEVQEHREVATMLAFTGMDAPDDVWGRIAAEIDGELEAPQPGPELARVMAFEPPSSSTISSEATGTVVADVTPIRRTRSQWLLGAAAAVALLVAGAAVFVGATNGSDDPLSDAYAAAQSAEASLQTELVAEGSSVAAIGVIDADGHGFLDAGDLPRLGDDLTYQLWGVIAENGDVVSIGILGNEPGLEAFSVDGDIAALAVTIEQAPGVISDGNPDGAYVGAFG